MNAIPPTNSPIVSAFVAHTPGSAAAYAEAREHFPAASRTTRAMSARTRSPSPAPRVRANGTWMATNMSTTRAAMAR